MRADVLTVMPPLALHKINGNDCSLRSSLHDNDGDVIMEPQSTDNAGLKENGKKALLNSSKRPSVSLTWAQNGHANSFNGFGTGDSSKQTDTGIAAPNLKKRSQSAKRPPTNSAGSGTESQQQPSKGTNPFQLKPLPPPRCGSALSRKRHGSGVKLKSAKSRDSCVGGSEGGCGDTIQESRTSSPSPHRRISSGNNSSRAETPGRGGSPPRGINRQPRRRLPSKSEDISLSNGDLLSPRSGTSDRLQNSFNGTLTSDSSDDSRQRKSSSGGGGVDGGLSCSPSSPTRAWDFFEEHVRTIHGSDIFSKHQGPSFNASCTFQETMVDLFGYPDYSHPPQAATPGIQSVAARGMVVAGAANRFLQLRKRSVAGGGFGFGARRERPPPDRQTVENAKRGWRVLRNYVQETYASKRTSQAALSWSMLRQTLKGMSDREKTRMDLYRRYGVIPTPDNAGRPVMINTMLSERARNAIANGARHPLLVHHQDAPATHSSSPTLQQSPRLSMLSRDVVGGQQEVSRRRAQSSVVRGARANVGAYTAGPSEGGGSLGGRGGSGGGRMLRTGFRKSAEFSALASSRSHTP